MQSFLDERSVQVIVRLTHSESLNNEELLVPRANRFGFEFDGVDARASQEEILAAIRGEGSGKPLTLLRVVTTLDHFLHLVDRDEIAEGDWFSVQLDARGKQPGPYAWAAPLEVGGYLRSRRFVLGEITWLFRDNDEPLRPLSAAVPAGRALAQTIAAACQFPASAMGKLPQVRKLLRTLTPAHDAVVHDVGQASFVSLRDKHGAEIIHLDAGWPTPWNIQTAPAKLPTLKSSNAPVILSHWDWDHLHAYHRIPALAAAVWITPIQKLSPTKQRIAETLAKDGRLLGVSARRVSGGPITVGRCAGKKKDFNNSGLAVRTHLASGKDLLFVGDAHYDMVPRSIRGPADLLVVTHHGADVAGTVVAPKGRAGQAVISVGSGNAYRHPCSETVKTHEQNGWVLSYTSGPLPPNRGERMLGP